MKDKSVLSLPQSPAVTAAYGGGPLCPEDISPYYGELPSSEGASVQLILYFVILAGYTCDNATVNEALIINMSQYPLVLSEHQLILILTLKRYVGTLGKNDNTAIAGFRHLAGAEMQGRCIYLQSLALLNIESLDLGRIYFAVNNVLNRTKEKDKIGGSNVDLTALVPLNCVQLVAVTVAIACLRR